MITSTLHPNAHSFFNVEDRYIQTIETINSLKEKGFEEIYLFDNSSQQVDFERIKNESLNDLKTFQTPQYTFKNKGLNEALLVLNNLNQLPSEKPIFKISGRYRTNEKFEIGILVQQLKDYEILGTGHALDHKKGFFNTRAYVVEHKAALESILVLVVEEMIAYGRGINGGSGVLQYLTKQKIVGTPFQLSLEQAFAKILSYRKNYLLLEKINIEGHIAGSDNLDFISE